MAKKAAENTEIDTKSLWAMIEAAAVDKPTTPRQIVDPVFEFITQLDAQLEAFATGIAIRGGWAKKSKAGRWIVKFGRDPLVLSKGKKMVEAKTDDEVLKLFGAIRVLAQTDENLRQQIIEKHDARMAARKPRKPK
ncbi:hypothetical protein G6L37_11940 [Agrobacterium rubi]|uniref:hypothetical protein n=1 Tax=Agrobacterium rubi TaxID=28099 RepID=UPI00157479CE|nr:hypothetical protein [Agrobacterium rubi]NTF06873.1 hypothetical protein [Agrobacterium rubi]NTF19115.1 hypothetical protein [Agrobacterium rubi]NTF26078.1 hypothetical protein [Agrobacterium rubi]